jgi:YegS/Rv2252/BmrU family lipid kinase
LRAPWDRALLIINTKSGPNNDSIRHVRDLVERLAGYGVEAEVRVKLRKKQARRVARQAARDGYPLVIAAGGDGTVQPVAAGLAGTKTVLGVVPLGTYNNIATSLGIPDDVAKSCALIAAGATRAIDIGWVEASGDKKRRPFLEVAGVGIDAALMEAGQSAKKGAWSEAMKRLPDVVQMAPAAARLVLDGASPPRQVDTLLIEIANAPRKGPSIRVAPNAYMDDSLLDVIIYEDVGLPGLVSRLVAMKAGVVPDDDRVSRARAQHIEVETSSPMQVVADAKVVGVTPARFGVDAGALLVVAGNGDGLLRPAAEPLVAAATGNGHGTTLAVAELDADRARTETDSVVSKSGGAAPVGRASGRLPVAAAAAIALPILGFLARRLRR